MVTKQPPTTKTRASRRTPIGQDFGTYLRNLRVRKNITIKRVAEGLNLSYSTVANIEDGYNPPPNQERLRLWLKLIGESGRFIEASRFLRSIRTSRRIDYHPRNPANEHLDRLIDAYETGRLTEADLQLLRMIAPQEYK